MIGGCCGVIRCAVEIFRYVGTDYGRKVMLTRVVVMRVTHRRKLLHGTDEGRRRWEPSALQVDEGRELVRLTGVETQS